MTTDRWQEIVEMVKESFEVLDSGSYESDEHGGMVTEFIEFDGPMGRLRLEFTTRPALVDTKTHYSNRIGSETKIENIYSDTEEIHDLGVYKFDEATNDWQEFETPAFS